MIDTILVDLIAECTDAFGQQATIPVTLKYRVSDPFAVSVVFHQKDADVVWTFSRELFTVHDFPHGDVTVSYRDFDDSVFSVLKLNSPDGSMDVFLPAPAVDTFFKLTTQRVPLGEESQYLDLDSLAEKLLSDS